MILHNIMQRTWIDTAKFESYKMQSNQEDTERYLLISTVFNSTVVLWLSGPVWFEAIKFWEPIQVNGMGGPVRAGIKGRTPDTGYETNVREKLRQQGALYSDEVV